MHNQNPFYNPYTPHMRISMLSVLTSVWSLGMRLGLRFSAATPVSRQRLPSVQAIGLRPGVELYTLGTAVNHAAAP